MLIEKTITKFCIAKGIATSTEQIDIQAAYLRKTEFAENEIVRAIGNLFDKTPFFPDASMILKELRPTREDCTIEAQSIVDKILEANTMFGSALDAKEYLGATAWRVVERFGGWSCITNLTYSDLGTARAQLRRVAEAAIINKTSDPKLEYSANAKQEIAQGELSKLDYSEFLKK